MTDFPYLPLWTDAYLADTRHLSATEHGSYLLLLMTAWRTKDCSLPDDDKLLARFCSLRLQQWMKIKPTIMEFFEVENGKIKQKKLTQMYHFANTKRESARSNGKHGGLAKALKNNDTTLANAKISPEQNLATKLNYTNTINTNNSITPSTDVESEFDTWWEIYPRKVGKAEAKRKFAVALTKVKLKALISATRKYVQVQPDVRYTAYPATWLNQERWADDPSHINPRSTSRSSTGRPQRADLTSVIRSITSEPKV